MKVVPYCSVVGSLMYAQVCTCPDIAFVVGVLCETPRKSTFSKNGKIIILVKIQNFSRSRMTKRTSPLESSREI